MVTSWAVSQIDLSDPGFWGRPFGERDAAFELLRRERPVAFFPEPAVPLLPPGPGFWALTRHEDVAMASREPGLFSSAPGSVLPDLPAGPPFSYLRSMIDMDDPGHARMRRLAAAVFTLRAVRQLTGRVEAACQEIIDEVIERGECDMAADVALPLASRLAEIQALFRGLFTRMPDLQVTGDPHWLRSSSINGIKHLPVRYTPSRPRA